MMKDIWKFNTVIKTGWVFD